MDHCKNHNHYGKRCRLKPEHQGPCRFVEEQDDSPSFPATSYDPGPSIDVPSFDPSPVDPGSGGGWDGGGGGFDGGGSSGSW